MPSALNSSAYHAIASIAPSPESAIAISDAASRLSLSLQ